MLDPRDDSAHADNSVPLRPLPSGARNKRNIVSAPFSGLPNVFSRDSKFDGKGDATTDTFVSDCEIPCELNFPGGPNAYVFCRIMGMKKN